MKHFLFIIIAYWMAHSLACAQMARVPQDPLVIKKHRIKSVSVTSKDAVFGAEDKPREIARIAFSPDGKVMNKTFLYPDIMLYSETFVYKYDKQDRLVQKSKVQQDFPLDQEDSLLVEDKKDSNYIYPATKDTYQYDGNGNLIRVYSFPRNSDRPTKRKDYFYSEQGNKVMEKSWDMRDSSISPICLDSTRYFYDDDDRLAMIGTKSVGSDHVSITRMRYDSASRKTAESSFREHHPPIEIKYTYQQDYLVREDHYENFERKYQVFYEYSPTGCLIKEAHVDSAGDKSIIWFECDKRGLIVNEHHTDRHGKRWISYDTTYEYY